MTIHRVLKSGIPVLSALPVFLAQFVASTAYAIEWQEQAVRLQEVNASLLDNIPIGEPLIGSGKLALEAKAILSIPPHISPKVGAKTEKVPSTPVQTVPTLQVNSSFFRSGRFALGAQAWGGYLVPGMQALFGIKATVGEWIGGAAVVPEIALGPVDLELPVGFQYGSASITGAITAPDANDSFTSTSTIVTFAPGVRMRAFPMFANVLFAMKNTSSTFDIGSDQTHFALTDTLADASVPFATQATIGYRHPWGIQAALSELWVPDRLLMPRLTLSYQYRFL